MALLLLSSAVSMAAVDRLTITSEDVRGYVGDTVTVALDIVIDPPKLGQTMDSLQFVLEYDGAALEFLGIQEVSRDRVNILGAQYLCSVTARTGAVAFSAAATNGATGSGILMHVRFRILSASSTRLTLKKVAYSFVNRSGTAQARYMAGVMDLGRVTGESVPATPSPTPLAPVETPAPAATPTSKTDVWAYILSRLAAMLTPEG